MYQHLKIIASIVFTMHFATGMTVAEFKAFVSQELLKKYKICADDIDVEILHAEQLPLYKYQIAHLKIQFDDNLLRPGICKLWMINDRDRESPERRAFFIRIGLWREVIVAATNLEMNEIINNDKINIQRKYFKHPTDNGFTSKNELENKMTKQRISQGEIITSHMVKDIPSITSGKPVKVKITYGNILIETSGRVNKEAKIGERVPVICDYMRQKLSGILAASDIVEVQLR